MSSIRFYFDDESLLGSEVKDTIHKESYVDRTVKALYVQFTDHSDFLCKQPHSCISPNLLKYLDENCTRVSMRVNGVGEIRPEIEGETKNFHLEYANGVKVSGSYGVGGKCDVLISANSSSQALAAFRGITTGIFQDSNWQLKKLMVMNFLQRFRFAFRI